jgi:nucleotide-binding universal stress UspA family protein
VASEVHRFPGVMVSRDEKAFEEFAAGFIRRHRAAPTPWAVERILVATDFSLCSLNALGHAEALARTLGAEIVLVHVDAVPVAGSDRAAVKRALVEGKLALAADQLHDRGLRARTVLRVGAADEEILDAAETERASLIVVGTHGRSQVVRALLGSVAERVVRGARCPVLVVGIEKDR